MLLAGNGSVSRRVIIQPIMSYRKSQNDVKFPFFSANYMLKLKPDTHTVSVLYVKLNVKGELCLVGLYTEDTNAL